MKKAKGEREREVFVASKLNMALKKNVEGRNGMCITPTYFLVKIIDPRFKEKSFNN